MSIRGKLVFAIVISMLFLSLIFSAYLFVFMTKSSFQNLQGLESLARMTQGLIEEQEIPLSHLDESFLVDRSLQMTLSRIFPQGWAVYHRDKGIIKQKGSKISDKKIRKILRKKWQTKKNIIPEPGEKPFMALSWKSRKQEFFFLGIWPIALSQTSSHWNLIKGLGTIFLAGIIGVSFIIYLSASKLVIRPMEQISHAAYRISQGDYAHAIDVRKTFDEGQKLADSVNMMMEQLREYHDDMQEKIKKAYAENIKHQKNLIIAQRLAATGKLAAGIAHEINNPLGGMLNAIDVLKKETHSSSTKIKDYIELVEDGLTRIKDTVGKILQFHRSDRSLKPLPVNIMPALEKSLDFVAHRLKEKNITLHIQTIENMPHVLGNAMEFQQVFLNIFMNAIDAVVENGTIDIVFSRLENCIKIEIQDDGCGMNENDLNQIFDFFYTTKPAGEGTGLGLSIVYSLVRNHGGSIEIDSEKGKGTKVTLVFPIIGKENQGS